MRTDLDAHDKQALVENADGASRVVLVCEHASSFIPPEFNGLGLSEADAVSHAAWDPGALALAARVAVRLNAVLVAGQVSRLVYDCNRPPEAADAMPERSEVIEVPGNRGLSAAEKAARVNGVYVPFRDTLNRVMQQIADPILVTIHSFTPTYHGQARAVEVGVLHDADTRLADAMLGIEQPGLKVERNQPYGPEHGVTHTLKEHGLKHDRLNVMLEVRNDLITTAAEQDAMAGVVVNWVAEACAALGVKEGVTCRV